MRQYLKRILLNTVDQPYEVEVEEVRQDPKGLQEYGRGAGFTWYPDEDHGASI